MAAPQGPGINEIARIQMEAANRMISQPSFSAGSAGFSLGSEFPGVGTVMSMKYPDDIKTAIENVAKGSVLKAATGGLSTLENAKMNTGLAEMAAGLRGMSLQSMAGSGLGINAMMQSGVLGIIKKSNNQGAAK